MSRSAQSGAWVALFVRGIGAIALCLFASLADAGITVHFEGTAVDDSAVQRIVDLAAQRAGQNRWRYQRIGAGEVATLDSATLRMIEPDAKGGAKPLPDIRGIVIYPHEMSDPLYLVFGAERRTKNFVKTQFAGADVHVKVIELLETLKPQFADLDVDDEGEYWLRHDRTRLERHLTEAGAAMDALRATTPGAHGPVKRSDGRILDIVR